MAKQNAKNPAQTKKNTFIFDGKRLEEVNPQEQIPEPRLFKFYKEQIIPAMQEKFNYKSSMQVPKLQKICINIGVGEAASDPKLLQAALNELELICGQRPVVRKAKKAISNFKLRQGMPIGTSVTLRRTRMYEFLDRFINIASPRIRDFKGFSDKGFDGRGNLTLGIKEQIIFPELDVDKVNRISGMDISFVMSSRTDEEGMALLTEFGFPFRKKGNN
jgi:large subunit ribosomal protein L5